MNILRYNEERVEIPIGVPTFDWEDYKWVADLGRGGTGEVYNVVNVSSREFFTIKKIAIFSCEVNDKDHLNRIMHDMHLATSLDHINVMQCLGVCNNKYGIHFLYNCMPNSLSNEKIPDERHLAQIAYQILNGLSYLRKEKMFVFKHLTPGNILIDPSSGLVKIADVLTVKDKYVTLSCVTIDTTYMKYIAPENYHIDNVEGCDLQAERYSKSDAWSLGLCLLQFYIGTYPFDGHHYEKLKRCLLSGFYYEYGSTQSKVSRCDDVWPPRPPTGAPPLFSDFISSCLKLDVSQRADVDQLLKHDFITSHCSLVES